VDEKERMRAQHAKDGRMHKRRNKIRKEACRWKRK
jgi:hypothetical protein